MRMGDAPKVNIESISTGAMNLDIALGIGEYLKEELWKFMAQNLQVKLH